MARDWRDDKCIEAVYMRSHCATQKKYVYLHIYVFPVFFFFQFIAAVARFSRNALAYRIVDCVRKSSQVLRQLNHYGIYG